MPPKKTLYSKAPEPDARSRTWLSCPVCGAGGKYKLMDILCHSEWCHLAKKAADKKQQQNVAPSRH